MNKINSDRTGVVVIGRNEGERLRRCIESSFSESARVVYVDSGSTDHSTFVAHELGAEVVDLDMKKPFCAARARNVGYEKLMQAFPDCEFVQFIDGDCEFYHGWLKNAVEVFMQKPDVAIVAGYLSEKDPTYSIYNRLAELEWNFDGFGEVNAVGGVFMIRSSAFDQVGGFDSTVVAGEEPELCHRLRGCGWKIIRVEPKMATHDLAMKYFSQWWKRQIRGGYGCMSAVARFGISKYKRNMYLARFWSIWLITLVVILISNVFYDFNVVIVVFSALFAALWFLQTMRIVVREKMRGTPSILSLAYAWFTMVSFWPQMLGQFMYMIDARRKKGARLIEYRVVKRSEDD